MDDELNGAMIAAMTVVSAWSREAARDYPPPTAYVAVDGIGFAFFWGDALGHSVVLVDTKFDTLVVLSNLFGDSFLEDRMGVKLSDHPAHPVPSGYPIWSK